jgi:hypothetical protein
MKYTLSDMTVAVNAGDSKDEERTSATASMASPVERIRQSRSPPTSVVKN